LGCIYWWQTFKNWEKGIGTMKINIDRLMADMMELAEIGGTVDGGVSRVAMSEADVAGRAWFQQRVEHDGFDFRADGAGNLSAVFDIGAEETILIGSHLDTVPNGGRYDGALGVLTALEAVRTLRDAGVTLPFNVEVISFTDEEGGVFGMLGSRAVIGDLTSADISGLPNQEDLDAGMQRLGITQQSVLDARRDDIWAFVEVHIEQGTRLEEQGIDIGVVSSMVGIRMFRLTYRGVAAHAGTMPMDKRQDALWGVMDFLQTARQRVIEQYSPGVMNIGQLYLANGAGNIVPSQVEISLEFRNGSTDLLDEMEQVLRHLALDAADRNRLELVMEPLNAIAPSRMSDSVVKAIEAAAETLGLSHTSLFSFAGHDAQTMARRFPTGMFFVPSVNGISHNPKEYSRPEDVENAANVLLQTVLNLANG
jgi:N-carbamoyl-L-amino-acid hydrolase